MERKLYVVALALAAILAVGISLRPQNAQAACGNGYTYCQTMSVKGQSVAGISADVSNYVALASTTQAVLATVGNGGHVQNTTTQTGSSYTGTVPADLIFTSDSACTTLLNWEIESYSASSGALIAWVNIGTLSHTADNTVYMCYGKSSVTTWQGNVNSTWASNYVGIWHLPDGSTPNYNDSTAGAANLTGTNSPGGVSGQIDGAISTNGSNSRAAKITGWSGPSCMRDCPWSMEAWVYSNSAGTSQSVLSMGTDGSGGQDGLMVLSNGKWGGSGYNGNFIDSGIAASAATWTHIAVTYAGDSATAHFYVNGVDSGASYVSGHIVWGGGTTQNDVVIGAFYDGGYSGWFAGRIDEVRVTNNVESASQILADYTNQKDGQTMVTFGAEAGGGGGGGPTLYGGNPTVQFLGSIVQFFNGLFQFK